MKKIFLIILLLTMSSAQALSFRMSLFPVWKQLVLDSELNGLAYWTFVGGIGASTANNGFFAINYVPSQPTTYAVQSIQGMSIGSSYELKVVTGQKCNGSVNVDVINNVGTSVASIALGNPGSFSNNNSGNSIQTAIFTANSYSGTVKVNKTADPTSCQIEIDKIYITKL